MFLWLGRTTNNELRVEEADLLRMYRTWFLYDNNGQVFPLAEKPPTVLDTCWQRLEQYYFSSK